MRKSIWIAAAAVTGIAAAVASTNGIKDVITGQDAFVDAANLKPGSFRKIAVGDLTQPGKASPNPGRVVSRPEGAMPKAPEGFTVSLYARDGLKAPRQIRRAPNGDLIVAESNAGEIKIIRDNNGKPEISTFATGQRGVFGLAFYPPGPNPQYLYVGNNASMVRFPYKNVILRRPVRARLSSNFRRADTRRVTWSSRPMESACSLRSVPPITSPIRANLKSIAPTSSNTLPKASLFRFTLPASAIPSDSASTPRRAKCGARSTNAITSATISFPTTSRPSRNTAFTDGRGSTSASTKTIARNCNAPR